LYQRLQEIKGRFEAIFGNSEVNDSGTSEGNISNDASFRRDYGWYYVIDQLVRDTQGMNEDTILEWDAERFLFRLQYLKHKGELELFNLKHGQ